MHLCVCQYLNEEEENKEVPCPERLFGLKIISDHKWNSYVEPVAKDTEKIWLVPCIAPERT